MIRLSGLGFALKLLLELKTKLEFRLTRGNRMFFLYGGLYIYSTKLTQQLQQQLETTLPGSPRGFAFFRLRMKRGSIDGPEVMIAGVGRFGNSVIQFLNSISIAGALNGSIVSYHRFDAIENRTLVLRSGLEAKRASIFRPRDGAPATIWRTHAMIPNWSLERPCLEKFSQARHSLQVALDVPKPSESEMSPEGHLTVYVRGGDAFARKPEPNYAQPPLSFYLSILESKTWDSVEFVTEDKANPVLEPLAEWCESSKVSFSFSGHSLPHAIERVALARNLVSANGSFVPAIVYLARGKRDVYHFHKTPPALLCGEEVTLFVVEDTKGEYVQKLMSRNWQNRPDQQHLMLTYPQEFLRLKEPNHV